MRMCPRRPSQAMETWPRLATTSSPSTSSSSSSSSSSLHPPPLLDLADELWFFSSVVPFPSFSLPCLPLFSSLFSNSSPDPSTLLAQLMFSTTLSRRPLSSISSPSSPFLPLSLQQPEAQQPPWLQYSPWDLPAHLTLPSPSDGKEVPRYGEDEDAYHRVRSHGDACSYGRLEDSYPAQFSSGRDEDEGAYAEYAYPAPRYGEDEDAYPAPGYGNTDPAPGCERDENAYPAVADDDENTGHADVNEEQQQEVLDCEHADLVVVPGDLDAEDALPGIYDVGVLLKDQYHKEREVTQHNSGRQIVLDMVLPESWPRGAELFQDGGEIKNIEENVGNTKTNMGNRELGTIGMAPHVAKRNMGNRDIHMTGMAPHVARSMPNDGRRDMGNRKLDMTGMTPHVAKTHMGNRELDTTGMASARSMLNDGRGDNSLTLSYVPLNKKILPIMSSLPSEQVLSCNEQEEMKKLLKSWAHVVASTAHLKTGLRAKRLS